MIHLRVRPYPGIDTDRQGDHQRKENGQEAHFHGDGQRLQEDSGDRRVCPHGPAQVTLQHPVEPARVLDMDRQIQPQMFPDQSPGIVIGNKSLVTDHDVDGIPRDEAQAEEYQDRDNQQGGDDQEESSEDIGLHGIFLF